MLVVGKEIEDLYGRKLHRGEIALDLGADAVFRIRAGGQVKRLSKRRYENPVVSSLGYENAGDREREAVAELARVALGARLRDDRS